MATDVQLNWEHLIGAWQTLEHGQAESWFTQLRNKAFPEKTVDAVKAKFYREKRSRLGKSKESPKEVDAKKLELCRIIIEMKERGKQRADAARELPTKLCIRRLVDRGVMPEGYMSASHANTLMRERLAYREKTPRVRWEVDRALAEVQTDGSVSKYYRPWKLSDDGNDVLLKASGRPLRYKGRDAGHTKLILWQYQDKYSRLRIVRAVPGKAEDTLIALGTMQFWLNRDQDGHLLRHAPWSFGHDNGSLFRTQSWRAILRALELDPDNTADDRSSVPYEKTGIGSVERSWQPIWTFEMALSEDYPTLWLSEYNMRLHEAMMAEQKMKHPYFSGYRGDLYQRSLLCQEPRPRVLSQDVLDLATKRYERKVTSELTISIDNVKYQIPQYYAGQSTQGQWVVAWKNWRGALRGELRDHHCEQPFAMKPYEHQLKGEYSSYKRTYQQKVKNMISDGNSFYEAVMNGQMKINDDGDYVDQRTGEVKGKNGVEAEGKIERLQPVDEEIKPDSPFSKRPSPQPPSKGDSFSSAFKAKAWIGRQLQAYEVTYADVSDYFDPILACGLERAPIEEAAQTLIRQININMKTGS